MSGPQKLVLLIGTAALVYCLAYPEMEYPTGYNRQVINGVVVRNDVYVGKDDKYFREAEKPGHRVNYTAVFEQSIAIIAASAVLFIVIGELQSRKKVKVKSL